MTEEVLSQAEVESLLSAMDAGGTRVRRSFQRQPAAPARR